MNTPDIFNNMRVGLYLCIKGQCDMILNDHLCHLTSGNIFVKSPLIQISIQQEYDDFEFVAIIEEDIEFLAPIAENVFDVIQNLFLKNRFHYTLSSDEQKFFLERKNLINKYKNEFTHDMPLLEQRITKQIIILMEQTTILEYAKIILKYNDCKYDGIEKREREVMVKFVFLLFQHYKHHRQVQFYAQSLHFSPNHFTKIIKNVSSRTPSEWISIITINQAKKLLQLNNKSIKEIAQELGFPEQYTFRKYFKLYTGISPKEYKNKLNI